MIILSIILSIILALLITVYFHYILLLKVYLLIKVYFVFPHFGRNESHTCLTCIAGGWKPFPACIVTH
jgi:hypothetical protein